MSYRFLLLLSTFFITVLCASGKKEKERPNILFAIADDVSWKHMGAYGCNWVKTPAFDKVASAGILFTRAYTPNAKCAPSRSCILTGRNSWQLEEACNHFPFFPEKFKTYAEALGENGYWVGSIAKGWAPGDPGKRNGKTRELAGPNFDKYKTTPPTKQISDNDYARNFEYFLEMRPKGKPFCFWYGSLEPHRGYEFEAGIKKGGKSLKDINEVPAFWPDVDSVRKDMLDYAFEIEYFDQHLQKMLKKLEETGELENTIVVVTSDNGMPFPRAKGQVYEYSNHLPLAIMWPKGIKNPGRVVHDFVSFIDFTPTFLEVSGLTAEKAGMMAVTGTSLTDIFLSAKNGKINPKRNFVLLGKERHDVGRPNDEGYPIRGIVKDSFLYIRNFEITRWPVGNPETGYLNCDGGATKSYILNSRRVRKEQFFWQLNFGKRVEEELYNIVSDPFCMKNRANDKPYQKLKLVLKNEMEQKLTQQKDPRMFGNGKIFDNYIYSGKEQNFYNRFMSGEKLKAGWVNETDFEKERF